MCWFFLFHENTLWHMNTGTRCTVVDSDTTRKPRKYFIPFLLICRFKSAAHAAFLQRYSSGLWTKMLKLNSATQNIYLFDSLLSVSRFRVESLSHQEQNRHRVTWMLSDLHMIVVFRLKEWHRIRERIRALLWATQRRQWRELISFRRHKAEHAIIALFRRD